MLGRFKRQRAQQELHRVSAGIMLSPLDESLEELDAIDTSLLPPDDLALWLNNRAYVLALSGRATEALADLDHAETLVVSSANTMPYLVLADCIVGTRGIALLHAGQLDAAVIALEDAIARGMPHLTSEDPALRGVQRSLAAERMWWLAEVAHRRGETERCQQLLRRASELDDTSYGEKARQRLGDPSQRL